MKDYGIKYLVEIGSAMMDREIWTLIAIYDRATDELK